VRELGNRYGVWMESAMSGDLICEEKGALDGDCEWVCNW